MKKRLVDEIVKNNINSSMTITNDWDTDIYDTKSREYCTYCKQENTFSHEALIAKKFDRKFFYAYTHKDYYGFQHDKDIEFYVAKCSMNDSHIILYGAQRQGNKIFKFAEFPFDVIKSKIKSPKGELVQKLKLEDLFMKAYVSAQNNLWIGAIVYVRKILETIIDHLINDENDAKNKKMIGEKIELIKNDLPEWVKNNIKKISKILGHSIHNLSDDQAKQDYNFILNTISLMISKIENAIKEKNMENDLQQELNDYNI